MTKTEMKLDDFLYDDKYKSIINLTMAFQHKEGGLEQKHYRYVLVKKSGIKQKLYYLKSFFEDKAGYNLLEPLIESDRIIENCIRPGTSLNEHLKKLITRGILEPANSDETITKYKVPITIFNAFSRFDDKYTIDIYKNDFFKSITDIIGFKKPDIKTPFEPVIAGNLYGFPVNYDEIITRKETKLIEKLILDIYSNLLTINNINYKYSNGVNMITLCATVSMDPRLDKLNKWIKNDLTKMKDTDVEKVIRFTQNILKKNF